MRNAVSRRGVLLAVLIVGALSVPAYGQFKVVHSPESIHTNHAVNFFLEFDSSVRFDGVYLAVPTGWNLNKVELISKSGRVYGVDIRGVENTSNRFYLIPSRRMINTDQLLLGIETGEIDGSFSFRATPFHLAVSGFESRLELLDGFSIRHEMDIEVERQLRGNRVLSIGDAATGPFILPRVDLASAAAFTAEFWINTASTNSIVMSTWDGNEESAYPFELLLDGGGHLSFFRGNPGEHRSMRSQEPVSDGSWHHVAVSYDQDAQWSRLMVDGASSDSLFFPSPLLMQGDTELVVAGRTTQSGLTPIGLEPLRGFIDEIRFWDHSRSRKAIRESMRQHLGLESTGLRVFSFDSDDATQVQLNSEAIVIHESDLSFYEPIEDFDVTLDASSVLLEWQVVDPNVSTFLVERSIEGADYDVLSEINVNRIPGNLGSDAIQRFRDQSVPTAIAFYRIKQVFSDGTHTTSAAVKIGMGAEDTVTSGTLTGNFPNPFNPTTTITYQLTEAGPIQVSVWDLSGQMIALLVDAQKDQGQHEVQFDATELPSGTYFVRMRTVDGVQTRQMILMK